MSGNLFRIAKADAQTLGLRAGEFAILRRLSSPEKIQDFVTAIPSNHEIGGETYLSVREVLRQRRCHCIEAAQLAACAFWIHGEAPLLMNLGALRDVDHVVALFRRRGRWGAISKSNGVSLRYRNPIYRSLRELALSFHHEYANRRGQLSLVRYSRPFDLRHMKVAQWVTHPGKCIDVVYKLDELPHDDLVTVKEMKALRPLKKWEKGIRGIKEHPRPRVQKGKV